jgi:hypothetical protein
MAKKPIPTISDLGLPPDIAADLYSISSQYANGKTELDTWKLHMDGDSHGNNASGKPALKPRLLSLLKAMGIDGYLFEKAGVTYRVTLRPGKNVTVKRDLLINQGVDVAVINSATVETPFTSVVLAIDSEE